MPAFTTPRLLVTVLAIGVLIPGAAVVPAQAAAKAPAVVAKRPPSDRTSALEARRVDRVPTPKLGWYPCYGNAECATARLPLDYDRPHGATTVVAVLRVKAKDQKHRIGSLFVNPGGPGGSGTGLAQAAPYFLSPDVLARFDVVGIDPRGTNFSDEVACFAGNAQQGKVLSGLNVAFPFTKAEEQAAVSSSKGLGKACSTTGKPLSAAMSTAEVARDMDVIRRGVGDKRLSYLGFSYGSYLGQVYANLFPDRVRAVAIDGVLDPVAWAGTKATASQPQGDRIRSADGATKALHQILVLCDKAGGQKCRFSPGNPVVNYDVVAGRLKAKPLVFTDPDTGEHGHVHLCRPRERHARLALRPLRLPRDHRQPGGPDHPHRAPGQGLVRGRSGTPGHGGAVVRQRASPHRRSGTAAAAAGTSPTTTPSRPPRECCAPTG